MCVGFWANVDSMSACSSYFCRSQHEKPLLSIRASASSKNGVCYISRRICIDQMIPNASVMFGSKLWWLSSSRAAIRRESRLHSKCSKSPTPTLIFITIVSMHLILSCLVPSPCPYVCIPHLLTSLAVHGGHSEGSVTQDQVLVRRRVCNGMLRGQWWL